MFEYMGDRLSNAIKNIRGMGRITEENISEAMREIRMALLEADVNYQVVKEFVNKVKEKALGMEVEKSIKPDELFIKIVKDELVELLGGEKEDLYTSGNPSILMLVGLQGTGKTTHIAKIAKLIKNKHNRKPMIIAADNIRMAAVEQLDVLGQEIGVEVFKADIENKAVDIVKMGMDYAKSHSYDTVLIDTAGRLHIDEALMEELEELNQGYKQGTQSWDL